MIERHYDPIDNRWLTWRPLGDRSLHAIPRGLGDEELIEVCALGSCGNPEDPEFTSWRLDTLIPTLEQYGVADRVFNPEVANWTPLRAPIEGIHTARASVLTVPVGTNTASQASIMEAGFATYGGVLRGQQVIVSIEQSEDAPEETKVARSLASSVLAATQRAYPLFTLAPNLEVLSHAAGVALSQRILTKEAGLDITTTVKMPPQRGDLQPLVYLSGTSGKRKPAWMKKVQEIIHSNSAVTPIVDSYREKWGEYEQAEELGHKLNDAVHLIAITGDTESYGALAELGPRIFQADMSGQSIGVLLDNHPSKAASATNRTRTLAREHLNRLHQDFPNLRVFLAENLEQLAIFGLSEYFQQCRRLQHQTNR